MSKDLTITELESWIPLLEMFSDKHSVLQGAAGEDAMNVGDILEIIRSHIVCRAVTNLCCKKDRMPTEGAPPIVVKAIIDELASIADACADLDQNKRRGHNEPIMQWDDAKLTLGTIRKARWIRDGTAESPLRRSE